MSDRLPLLFLSLACLAFPARAAAQVAASPQQVCPRLAGTEIPDVTLRTLEGEPLVLRKAVAERPTVLIFYRGSW